MRRPRIVAALAASALLAGMSSVPPQAAAATVPAGCASDTVGSEYIGGDDFAPDSGRTATWASKPAGVFEVKRGEEAGGDGWQMHGKHHPSSGYQDAGGAMTSRIQLPHGRRIVLAMKHAYALANGSEVFIDIQAADGTFDGPEFTDSSSGFYRGSSGPRTSTADISRLAGKNVWLTLKFRMGSSRPTETETGWHIDDLAIYTCDSDSPSGPSKLVSKPGYTAIVTSWQPPVVRPDLVEGYQARLIDVADASRNRVANLTAAARQWRFTGLTPGRTYRVEVGTAGRFSSGPVHHGSLAGTSVPLTQTFTYSGQVDLAGPARCKRKYNWDDGVNLLVQRKPAGTTNWVTHGYTRAFPDGYLATGRPSRHTEYRAIFRPGTYLGVSCMGYVSKTVKARVKMWLPEPGNSRYYYTSEPVVVKGKVKPAHAGMKVYLQRYDSGAKKWRTVLSQKLNRYSNYKFRFYKKPGRYAYRVVAPTHSDHLRGISQTERVRVG